MQSSLEKWDNHENPLFTSESSRIVMYQLKGLCSPRMKRMSFTPLHILSFSFGGEKSLYLFIYVRKIVLEEEMRVTVII